MPWYKAGTVSVTLNSNAVIGTGTAFIANSRVGDGFRGPDGGWYEVTNIASDTAMSISPNYQGATNTAGGYALAPLQGYVKDSADALRSLVNQFGDKLAALGSTGNYEILPVNKGGTGGTDGRLVLAELGVQSPAALYTTLGMYFGWNGGDGATGAGNFVVNRGAGAGGYSWRSVNQGNTATGPTMTYSYEGVLTVPSLAVSSPISVGSGGTGGNSQATARAGLGLGSSSTADLVGLVESGAIIESSANANGSFTKFADGTLICRRKERTVKTLNQVSGSLYWGGAEGAKTFPAAFIAAPAIIITASLEVGEAWFTGAASLLLSTATWPNGIVFSQVSRPVQQVAVDYLAIGRWKA